MSRQPINTKSEMLRKAMRFWATGIGILSVSNENTTHGMTVNSFASLTLEPPQVMVSLEKETRTHDLLREEGRFALTFLSSDQQALSERFAGRDTENTDRFEGVETFSLAGGNVGLAQGMVFLECDVLSSHDVGTHTMFVASVENIEFPPGEATKKSPLIYFDRTYRNIAEG